MYGYFDLIRFSARSKSEQTPIEKELIKIHKKHFESAVSLLTSSFTNRRTMPQANNISEAWEAFLKSTNKELQQEVSTTSSIHDEFRHY